MKTPVIGLLKLIGCALLLAAHSVSAQIYLCTLEDGNKIYSDSPCADGSTTEKTLQPSDKPTGFDSLIKICGLELSAEFETISSADFIEGDRYPAGERSDKELQSLQTVLLLHDADDARIVAKKDDDIHICFPAVNDQSEKEFVIADGGSVYELGPDTTVILLAPEEINQSSDNP